METIILFIYKPPTIKGEKTPLHSKHSTLKLPQNILFLKKKNSP